MVIRIVADFVASQFDRLIARIEQLHPIGWARISFVDDEQTVRLFRLLRFALLAHVRRSQRDFGSWCDFPSTIRASGPIRQRRSCLLIQAVYDVAICILEYRRIPFAQAEIEIALAVLFLRKYGKFSRF
jgi:hypothetical protein